MALQGLSCATGGGSYSHILGALDWAVADARERAMPAIVQGSYGGLCASSGCIDSARHDAYLAAYDAGIHVIVAAGAAA